LPDCSEPNARRRPRRSQKRNWTTWIGRTPRRSCASTTAAREEADHLAWSAERILELGGRPSLLNPLWYAGSLALGIGAGLLGDRWSLAFLAETERQVEQHLRGHLERLARADARTRAVVETMRADEARHREAAVALGAAELPQPVKLAMRALAKVMTAVAYRV
jgi:ubiquinone biosynthesis monooxygenase Coq7